MRWLLIAALAAAVLVVSPPARADGVVGFDSHYFGESAFLALAPGASGQFAVGFTNTGPSGWQSGTPAQVDLAVCLADKTTCGVPSPNASWASNWYSSTAYATQSTSFVGPGQVGWFVYVVKAPAGAAGTVRFNGDLVMNATGEKIHPEGYFHEATAVALEPTATRLITTPTYQNARIGTFPILTATVTADPTSGTTRAPVPNTVVVFELNNSDALNPPMSLTAITDGNGNASVTYTRNNPGTDSVIAYVADLPNIRSGATLVWRLTAGSVSVTSDDATTVASDACRSYSLHATNPTSGAALANTTLRINFLENIGRTVDSDGGATIVGDTTGSPTPTIAIPRTTDGVGNATFQACGNGAERSLTPMVFDNFGNGDPNLLEAGDSADAGGMVTFQPRRPVVTVTPATSGGSTLGVQRVYTISATDQFGVAYTGPVRVSFVELHDGLSSTNTTASVTWYDNDASLATVGLTGGSAPAGATDVTDSQNLLIPSLNAVGQATFAVYSPIAGQGRPIVYIDANSDLVPQSTEAQSLGGLTTWAAPSLSSCSLTKSKPLAAPSPGSADTTVLSVGDVFFVMTFRDQSGASIAPPGPTTVTFSVTNAGPASVAARAEGRAVDTSVVAGGSASVQPAFQISSETTYVVVDSAGAASATVTASASPGGVAVSCSVSVRWVNAQPEPTSGGLSGTVIDTEKGAGADGGGYVLQTSSGTYVITYAPGQPLIVVGVSSTETQFESALSNGDLLLWSYNSGAESHNITTNN